MKFKKNLLFFLTILLSSCGVKTNSNSINSINSKETSSTNSKITKPSAIDSDSTSEEIYYGTDVYSDDFKDDEDNGNYEFWDTISEIIIDEDSDYINIPVLLMFFKKLKTYDKYISIQYSFLNVLGKNYWSTEINTLDDLDPVKQGKPIFIQKQTDDFFEKHYANSTNKDYFRHYERFLFTVQIPTKEFLDTYKETGYFYFCLSFCEFAEADGYTYTNGVKDEFNKNHLYNKSFIEIDFRNGKYEIYHSQS